MREQEVESLLDPDERTLAAAAITFGSPDITPALNVKEYHCQLAKSLQVQHSEVEERLLQSQLCVHLHTNI